MKIKPLIIILLCNLAFSAVMFLIGYSIPTRKYLLNFDLTAKEYSEQEWKYEFLEQEKSNYICDLCSFIKMDSDLVVAILMVENPMFDENVEHRNENGTRDLGFFQLNERYVWTTFKDRYWLEGVELNPYNWKHNSFIAIHHIEYLQKKLKLQDDVIMAYNCGEGNVMNGTIPDRTREYLASVKNNLKLLKEKK